MKNLRQYEGNCEPDLEETVDLNISSISTELPPMSPESTNRPKTEEIPVEFKANSLSEVKDSVDQEIINYIHGNVILRFVDCTGCRKHMSEDEPKSRLIKNKTLPHCHLVCPKLLPIISQIRNFVFASLPQIGHLPNISSLLSQEFENLFFSTCDFHFLHEKCRERLHNVVLREVVKCFIRVFCKRKNEALKLNQNKTRLKTVGLRWTRLNRH